MLAAAMRAAAHRRWRGVLRAAVRAGMAMAAALAAAGCTYTYPVVGSFENYNEVFLGQVRATPFHGAAVIEVAGLNSGIQCSGDAWVTRVPYQSENRGCPGQRGEIMLQCSDGRQIQGVYTTRTCTSGYGFGRDDRGGRFRFFFGMSPDDALARLEKAKADVANLPRLPAYRPREARGEGEAGGAGKAGGEEGYSTGTAFLVSTAGHLVTNFHVIEDAKEVLVHVGGKEVRAEVLKRDAHNDIALLKADIAGEPIILPREFKVGVADEVMTLGYPLVTIQGQSLKASFGRVNALSGIGDDPRYLQIDVPIQPGNSGGPLVNKRGELVGVVTATLNQAETYRAAGTLPQNVNYAVKADYVLPLLREVTPKRDSAPRDFKTLAEIYGKSVFLVIAK